MSDSVMMISSFNFYDATILKSEDVNDGEAKVARFLARILLHPRHKRFRRSFEERIVILKPYADELGIADLSAGCQFEAGDSGIFVSISQSDFSSYFFIGT
jgi:hypothetical protein